MDSESDEALQTALRIKKVLKREFESWLINETQYDKEELVKITTTNIIDESDRKAGLVWNGFDSRLAFQYSAYIEAEKDKRGLE